MDQIAPERDSPRVAPGPAAKGIDGDAFRRAYLDHRALILRYATSRVGDTAAEDVVGETFTQAWQIRARFDPSAPGGMAPWLLGIATRAIARQRRSERRWLRMCADTATHCEDGVEGASVDGDVAARLDSEGRARRLARALAHMPARERDALLLQALGGLTYEEIAAALDVPVGTVRSRISRGRARLESRIEGAQRDH